MMKAHPGSTSWVRIGVLNKPLLDTDLDSRGIWPLPRILTARLGGFNLWLLLCLDQGTPGWSSSCG